MIYTNHSLTYPSFRDPGKPQKELFGVPGFINELKRHTLAVAPRPNEPLAFAGALAMLTHLTGRSYVSERGLHTNLYVVALAPSGMGKEEPRITNQHLANEAGIIDSVPDSVASGEGLEDAMMRRPSLLMQTDEADSLFSAMRKDDSRAARLSEMVLRFFSDSKGVHIVRLKAGGQLDRTTLLRSLHIDATTFAKIVKTLHLCDLIEEEMIDRRKTLYTLKTEN